MSNSANSTYNPDLDPLHLYGYIPTEWVCITILTLFSVTTGQLFFQPFLFASISNLVWFSYPCCGSGPYQAAAMVATPYDSDVWCGRNNRMGRATDGQQESSEPQCVFATVS